MSKLLQAGWAIALSVAACGCDDSTTAGPPPPQPIGNKAAASAVGERLFVETRFAQFFRASGADINDSLDEGDPTVKYTVTTGKPLPGPFAGMSMNCRSCHLVDEQVGVPHGGMRTYADFARRSPIPPRGDGNTTTPRNSPPLVNATLGTIFHFDGQFNTPADLVIGTLTGRNFGYLPEEETEAIQQVGKVIREDDGTGKIAREFDGNPYRVLLTGTDADLHQDVRLTPEYRIGVDTATDRQIVNGVAQLIVAYVNSLRFRGKTDSGKPIRSPFDVFLSTNGLPARPATDESPRHFSRRLRGLVEAIDHPKFVTRDPYRADGKFQYHPEPFAFGEQELAGMRIFFAEPMRTKAAEKEAQSGVGNCIACHAAPEFTDFKMHTTGTSQIEYDDLHGDGSFARLSIPGLAARRDDPDAFLPATPQHPNANDRFRSPAGHDDSLTDLGAWNVFANDDFPAPQEKLREILCADQPIPCPSDATILPTAIARFKTPGLIDLGHSAPYMHNGHFDHFVDVIQFYLKVSALKRKGELRNGAHQLADVSLDHADIAPLAAFLTSLNEDYQ